MNAALLVLCLQTTPTIDVEAGFNGDLFRDSWTRVWVTLQNPGPDLDGELRLRAAGGLGEPVQLRRPVTLASKGKRRISWDLFLESGEDEIVAELLDGKGRILSVRSVPIRFLPHRARRVVVLGTTPSAFVAEDVALARLKPELVPDRLPPLLAADLIVFAEPVALEPGQEEALDLWVRRGGVLLYSTGRLPAAAQRRFWRDLSPAETSGIENVTADGRTTALVRAKPRPGALPFGSIAGRPLGYRAVRGRGAVVLLLLPFDADDFDRRIPPALLLEQAFGTPRRVEADPEPYRLLLDGSFTEDVRTLRDRIGPSDGGRISLTRVLLGASLVAAYAFGVGPYTWLRSRRRLRQGAAFFVLLTGTALLAVYGWGSLFSTRPALVEHRAFVDTELVQGCSFVQAGPSSRFSFSYPGLLATTPGHYSLARFERLQPPIHGEEGRLELTLPALAVRPLAWARGAVAGEAGLRAAWTDEGRSALKVRNPGTGRATGVRLMQRGGVAALPELEPGASLEVPAAAIRIVPWKAWIGKLLFPDSDGHQPFGRWELSRLQGRDGMLLAGFARRFGIEAGAASAEGLRELDWSPLLDRGEEVVVGWIDDALVVPAAQPALETRTWALARCVVEAP